MQKEMKEIEEEFKEPSTGHHSAHSSERLGLMKSKTINFNFGSITQAHYGGRRIAHSGDLKNEKKLKESVSLQNTTAGPLIVVEEEFADEQDIYDEKSFDGLNKEV